MIITKQWLNEFIDILDIDADRICKTLNAIGLEVDSLHTVSIPTKIVVAKVLECQKHPDADKLNVCQVDIGTEVVQIVCGASNVAAGQYVAAATIGADLGNNFIIKKAKLRGEQSNGMLCSSTELGLPKMNDGLMLLDESIGELVLGRELCTYSLINDSIIEVELTANRGDCLNIFGVARELSVAYERNILEQEVIKSKHHISIGQVLDIKTTKRDQANLIYVAGSIKELQVPLLMQLRCAVIGKYSDNKIAMLKEYLEHTIGAIFSFYPKEVLMCKGGMCSLEIAHNTNGFDSIRANLEIVNVVGVQNSHFDDFQEEVIIEASYTNPEFLAQRVFETKQKTGDVYYKSSRGSNPDLKSAINYLRFLAPKLNFDVYGGSEEFCDDKENIKLDASVKKINAIIGQEIPKIKIEKILLALGFGVKDSGEDALSLQVPLFRHDIKNIADVAEEIVRIIGIDNIQAKALVFEEQNRINATTQFYALKNLIRTRAIASGFFETATYAFSEKKLLEQYGFMSVGDKLDIANPITNELDSFRTTLLLNLIQAVAHNAKFGYKKIPFFEIGRIFDTLRRESNALAFVFSGQKESESLSNAAKPANLDFFGFANKVSNVIGEFELEPMDQISNKFIHPYQNGVIIKNNIQIGYIAKLHPQVAQEFDIDDTFICEIDFDKLQNDISIAKNISKFQPVKRDLSLLVPQSLPFGDVRRAILGLGIEDLRQLNLIDIYSDEKLGDNDSVTIRFVLQSETKTLEEEQINAIMDQVLEALQTKLNILIR